MDPGRGIKQARDQSGESNVATFLGDLKHNERRTLYACFGGWALDSFDVNLYALVIPTLLATLNFTLPQAGVLATSALLLSAVGGWFAGTLADKYGRVRVLQITILWFAFFTFLAGFCNTFGQFFVVRALQGLGFGGEWAAGAVLIGEVIQSKYRGRAVGVVQSGWAVGWGGATLVFAIVFSLLPQEIAWRVLFWTGLLPALLVVYIRRFVDEPEIFEKSRAADKDGAPAKLLQIFSRENIRLTVLTSLLTTGAQGGYYTVNTWLPTFLRTEKKLTVLGSSGYLAFVIIGAFCGFIACAWLADTIGRKRTFLLMALCAGLVVVVYMLAPITDSVMLLLGFPLGFFANGLFAPMGAYLTELFPTNIRATNQGFSYNAGRAIGALFPATIGYLGQAMGLGMAIGIFTVTAYLFILVALAMLPETLGRELREPALAQPVRQNAVIAG
ncbi:MFS transporter [Bradyrhizobium sp. NP1]|uniref:MFS transporter n=1 Tax=Bradyrhizobium sp. NP1 TaxID=3049772 RepID=UPI0025A52F08|nr:MFS transporter [Bradyrhizobium sp. NP1]WJR79886.1 MFS transporter [Bradyrhizobium sp. NP1]